MVDCSEQASRWQSTKWGRAVLIVATCALAVFVNAYVGKRAITGAAWILIIQPIAFAALGAERFRYTLPALALGLVLLAVGLGI